jgi:hypothetical protein
VRTWTEANIKWLEVYFWYQIHERSATKSDTNTKSLKKISVPMKPQGTLRYHKNLPLDHKLSYIKWVHFFFNGLFSQCLFSSSVFIWFSSYNQSYASMGVANGGCVTRRCLVVKVQDEHKNTPWFQVVIKSKHIGIFLQKWWLRLHKISWVNVSAVPYL